MSFRDKLFFKLFKTELSYSQTGEDKILLHFFNSIGKRKIRYLDIGANHPIINNNTYIFYRRGSQGVCVEPNPVLSDLIQKVRSRDKCLNIGIGIREETVAEFYSMTSHTLSTFSKKDAYDLDKEGKYKIKEVLQIPLKSINTIISENFTEPVDLVSIDVEGWNEEIVASFDFNRYRPLCFCVETLGFSDGVDGKKFDKIFEVFKKNNYSVYGETHLNTIFLDNLVYKN